MDFSQNESRDLAAARRALKYPDGSGVEHVDDTPVEVPAGFRRPLTLQEQIRQFLRQEVGLARLGVDSTETFEDSLDLGEDADEALTPAESRAAAEEQLFRDAQEASNARARARHIRALKARSGGEAKPKEGAEPPAKPAVPDTSTPS